MLATDAGAIWERLTGIAWSPSTWEREARRQGERGQTYRVAMNAVFADGDSLVAATQQAAKTGPGDAVHMGH